MIIRKVTKVIRKFRWSLPTTGSVPLRWHVGQPNFGDDMNPYFFEKLIETPIRLASQGQPHLLGIGSILNTANRESIIIGCGLLSADMAPKAIPKRIISLRGFLTAESIDYDPGHYGDPALLTASLFPRSGKPAYRLGLIPHHSQTKRWKTIFDNDFINDSQDMLRFPAGGKSTKDFANSLLKKDVLYIDPGWSPLRVINAIAQCEGILSQSLHGLIIADAYGIPNGWLAPAPTMPGFDFKFADYYSTTMAPKCAIPINSIQRLIESKHLPLHVSPFRFDLPDYERYLKNEIIQESFAGQSDRSRKSMFLAAAS